MKKKTLTIAIALVLVVALAVGATWAYLTAQSGPVVNTFTVGKILDNANNFTLNEHPLKNANTTDGVYQLDMDATPVQAVTYSAVMPGVDLPKDPTVTIKAGALKADAYLFVVVDNKLANGLSYTLDSVWKAIGSTEDGKTLLTLDAGKLTAGNADALTWKVLGGTEVGAAGIDGAAARTNNGIPRQHLLLRLFETFSTGRTEGAVVGDGGITMWTNHKKSPLLFFY